MNSAIPVRTPEISLLAIARMQMIAIMYRVHAAGQVDGDPKKDKEDHHEYILERAGMLLECIRVCGRKCNTKGDHHQVSGTPELEGDPAVVDHGNKREQDREFVIAFEDRDEELLAIMGESIEKSKAAEDLHRKRSRFSLPAERKARMMISTRSSKTISQMIVPDFFEHQFPVLD